VKLVETIIMYIILSHNKRRTLSSLIRNSLDYIMAGGLWVVGACSLLILLVGGFVVLSFIAFFKPIVQEFTGIMRKYR
jgi:hypothetical protein